MTEQPGWADFLEIKPVMEPLRTFPVASFSLRASLRLPSRLPSLHGRRYDRFDLFKVAQAAFLAAVHSAVRCIPADLRIFIFLLQESIIDSHIQVLPGQRLLGSAFSQIIVEIDLDSCRRLSPSFQIKMIRPGVESGTLSPGFLYDRR